MYRLYHQDRLVQFEDRSGAWHEGNLKQAQDHLRPLARVQTTLVAKRGKQQHAKKQPVEVEVSACPVRVRYTTNVQRQGVGERVSREVWLVEVHIVGSDQDPWLLLTDWPVTDAHSATRIFTMYRQRWGLRTGSNF